MAAFHLKGLVRCAERDYSDKVRRRVLGRLAERLWPRSGRLNSLRRQLHIRQKTWSWSVGQPELRMLVHWLVEKWEEAWPWRAGKLYRMEIQWHVQSRENRRLWHEGIQEWLLPNWSVEK